ncbi:hypothetical protein [Streptomyces dangxiongensis]|uniref:hypothetical protein n=1 Tax=Streptomyces dangxiongensis TaxID=1442032 RepID=UPI0013CF11C5|nr:hypothetical protein [Streptomyces dangxiongensis]
MDHQLRQHPQPVRGDVLATTEAKYAADRNAGPAPWTSYQESGRSFAPDYAQGAIVLTSDSLSTIKDGAQVTLTYHFWSGATVTYRTTPSGTAVIGSAS